jgi:uncharacterized iron-regulated protein
VAAQPEAARIYDVHARRFVDDRTLVDALASARFRLLGEIHDDPAHHAIRARLLGEIAERGLRPAVVMEQFDLDHDGALRAAQRAHADADAVATQGGLDRKGWQWPMHRPIVEQALASKLPLRAGNLSRTALSGDLNAVLRQHPRVAERMHAARWSNAQAQAMRNDIVDAHCNMLPDTIVPTLVRAQRIRDAAMAQALVDDATADGALLIAGNGHVRDDLGVPIYLHVPDRRGARSTSISVGFLEASADEAVADGFPRALIAGHPGFDYVVITPAIERPDPCEAFRRTPKG